MMAMQYSFTLPADYDMSTHRPAHPRQGTDAGRISRALGFQGLSTPQARARPGPAGNLYAPFYLWQQPQRATTSLPPAPASKHRPESRLAPRPCERHGSVYAPRSPHAGGRGQPRHRGDRWTDRTLSARWPKTRELRKQTRNATARQAGHRRPLDLRLRPNEPGRPARFSRTSTAPLNGRLAGRAYRAGHRLPRPRSHQSPDDRAPTDPAVPVAPSPQARSSQSAPFRLEQAHRPARLNTA